MAYTTIDNSELYFQTKIYTGNGSTQAITLDGDEDMQPDFVWIKDRDATNSHRLTDSVRGVEKELYSNQTYTEDPNGGLTAFGSDGFSLNSNGSYNGNTVKYVAWNWKAGGSASSNSDGSITSTVSASTDAGFSIVSYTGNAGATETIGHGLGAVPSVIIVKRRSTTGDWIFYHKDVGNDGNLKLNTTNAKLTGITWRSTTPTSSVFTVGEDGGDYQVNNPSGATFIAYCFAEKQGYSKFGSYTGNGNANGTFVYTGFKPAFIMVKNTETSVNAWNMFDAKRSPFNVLNARLYASANSSEGTGNMCDFLSNGVKFRNTDSDYNSTHKFIYMAFAENPFVTSTGIPTTGR